MRICFFTASLGDGGAQRQCIALLNVLQHIPTVDVHLILLGPGENDDRLDVSGLQLHRIDVADFASPKALSFVVRTLRRVRPDLLISWLHPADIWSYAATRVVRGIPWVITERGSATAYPDQLVYNLRKLFGRRAAAAVIANSEPGRELWESLAPRASVQVIPNMVIDRTVPVEATGTPLVECLFVGRLEPQKNVGPMTTAFARFAARQPAARLVVVGQGAHHGDVERIAAETGLADRVELLGYRRDVPSLMSRARVLLSFSLHEGMPNVVMEAVAAGVPAVVSDIPEHRAVLGDDYPYYVRLAAPAEDAAAVIASAWVNGLGTDEHAYAYARAVLKTMAPEMVVDAYVEAFAKVISRTHSRVQA